MMKTTAKKMMLWAAMFMLPVFCFVACDDDPQEGDAASTYTFNVECSQDLLDVASIRYVTGGSTQSMITTGMLEGRSKNFSFTSKEPGSCGVGLSVVVDGSKLTKETYDIVLKVNGKVVTSTGAQLISSAARNMDMKGVKASVVKDIAGKNVSLGFTVSEGGQPSVSADEVQ